MKNKILILSSVLCLGIVASYVAFGWSEPTGSMPSDYKTPLNTSIETQDVTAGKPVVVNLDSDQVDGYNASDLLAATSSSSSCPDNYANLCTNGGGLEFVYEGKTLHIDATPRSPKVAIPIGSYLNFFFQYSTAVESCSIIGARVPSKEEFQAACEALGGPNGNGLTSFDHSLTGKIEFTSTSSKTRSDMITSALGGSCSNFGEVGVASVTGTEVWYRCIR
ncbi:MAG: hypothetical protein PHF25_09430 [Candidatus Margulisbacteria bacterium]|nr:hypothetical protein [Candidatus Margulisiibacteriota bacterium]